MKRIKTLVLAGLLVLAVPPALYPQTTSASNSAAPQNISFDTTGFPLWAKDLRRAEIVAFGSFPFTFFFAITIIDTYRTSKNNWDSRYAPWPFKSAGAVEMTQDQYALAIGSAAAGAIVVALVDFAIVQYKRNKAQKAAAALPDGSPIIIRRPLSDTSDTEEAPSPGGETGNSLP